MKLPIFLAGTAVLTALTACQTSPLSNAPIPPAPARSSPAQEAAPAPAVSSPAPLPAVPLTQEMTMFDGNSLTGWKVVNYGGQGDVTVADGVLKIGMGMDLSGIVWTNAHLLPKTDYEVELDARREQGYDFFCGLTFPVAESHCTLVLGGWGGGVTGLSSLDGMDASENETTRIMGFQNNRWYHVKLRVRTEKIEAWLDGEQIVKADIQGRKVSLRAGGIEDSVPFGLSTWMTAGGYKNIVIRPLKP